MSDLLPSGEASRLMKKALSKWVVKYLREKGFTGSYPNFRRFSNNHFDLVMFQFSQFARQFAVEIGVCPKEGVTLPGLGHIPGEKVKVCHLFIFGKERKRIGSNKGASDHWFKFDDGEKNPETYEQLAKEVIPFLEKEAEAWWLEK